MLAAITSRIDAYKNLKAEFNRINGSKIATFIDLRQSFMDTSKTPEIPKGNPGRHFYDRDPEIDFALQRFAFDGMPVFRLPTNVLATQTQSNFDRIYPPQAIEKPQRIEILEICGSQVRASFYHINARPSAIPCLYMDDFLDVLEFAAKTGRRMKIAAALGQEKDMMDILKSLRNVPDYSHHFPPRPPRNGKKDDKTKEKADFVPGRFHPAGMGA